MAKRKKKKNVLLIIITIIVIAIIALLYFLSSQSDDRTKVTTIKVDKRTITQTVNAIGKIEPETEVKISSETPGEIIFLNVNEGDTVITGDLLIKIKPDIIETQVDQFRAGVNAAKMDVEIRKAEMEKARTELDRATGLYKKEFISKQDYDRYNTIYAQAVSGYNASKARKDQSAASLKQIQYSAARTSLFAPIDGIVTKIDVEKGEKVVGTAQFQGTELLRISDLTVMNAEVEVDENDIVHIGIGDTAIIEIDALPDEILNGIVIEIGHSALVNAFGSQDQVTNFKVKIRIIDEEARLRPGMSCSVDIETETRFNVLSIPLQSVTVRDSVMNATPDLNEPTSGPRKIDNDDKKKKNYKPQSVVFLNKNGKAKIQEVEVGISNNGYIEITDGLSQGDEIISGPFKAISKELKDGTLIQVDKSRKNRRFSK